MSRNYRFAELSKAKSFVEYHGEIGQKPLLTVEQREKFDRKLSALTTLLSKSKNHSQKNAGDTQLEGIEDSDMANNDRPRPSF